MGDSLEDLLLEVHKLYPEVTSRETPFDVIINSTFVGENLHYSSSLYCKSREKVLYRGETDTTVLQSVKNLHSVIKRYQIPSPEDE